jgi:predicted enzyme related to lactoylglutathione lyase
VQIECIERVIVASPNLARSREAWARAGFAIAPESFVDGGLEFARLAAGAIEIDLVAAIKGVELTNALGSAVIEGARADGRIIGWVWGVSGSGDGAVGAAHPSAETPHVIVVPGADGAGEMAEIFNGALAGTFTAAVEVPSFEARRARLQARCGSNANTVDFLEHIVVMVPNLEEAIEANDALGVRCKRIREIGNGARQAFFKLEQTVIEVVGPSKALAGCWGLAFMCSDINRAIAHARASGLNATEPKSAIQGGMIARIIEPIDGAAIAFMQPGPRVDT